MHNINKAKCFKKYLLNLDHEMHDTFSQAEVNT